MAGARIQLKRATASSWSSNNPVLYAGEIGYETDTDKFKIGDGTTAYNSLSYFNGNLSGSSLNDLADVTIVSAANGDFLRWNGSAWVNDAVNLSVDTVGDYVESLVAGTGVTVTNNSGEATTPTIEIGQSVGTTDNVTFNTVTADLTGDVTGNVTGNVTGDVTGNADTATTLETARTISLGGDLSGSASFDGSADVTITATINADSTVLGTDTTGDYVESLVAGTGVTLTNNTGESATPTVAIGQAVETTSDVTFNTVTADVTGDLTGNADTATTLATSRTISLGGDLSGSASFDGSADVTITATIGANSVALGTDTTGNYVSDVTGGTGVTVTHTPGEGSSPTIAIGQAVGTTSDVTFNTVTADLTGDVTGNADTATTLATARTISLGGDLSGSASFNGSSDVTITATIGADSVALGTDTTGNYVNDVTAGTGVTVTHTPGEGSSPTIAIGQAVGTTSDVTFNTVTADLTGDVTGNADTATTLATARTISLGGDLSGSASFNGSADVTITATIAADSVALGTDTTGDYVGSLVAGTGVTLSNNSGEGATPTVAIGQSVGTSDSPTFAGATLDAVQVGITAAGEIDTASGNLTIDSAGGTVTVDDDLVVTGDLTVSGTTTTVNTETINLADNIITLNSNETGAPSQNAGIEVERGTLTNVVLRWNETTDSWELTEDGTTYKNIAVGQDVETTSNVTFNTVTADVTGDLTGNADTATALQTSRTIELTGDVTGSASFDGTANATLNVTISSDSVALGTDTTGDYVQNLVAGTGVTLGANSGEGATPSIAIGQDVGTTADVTFNTVTADLTGDVTGNADTATSLQTARNISLGGDLAGSASFDGSGDVTITATVQANSVALGTDTTGNYMVDLAEGTGITITHTPGEASTGTIAIGQDVATTADVTFNTVTADVTGDLTGNVTGNADTATALQTSRTISLGGDLSGSASFNGSADVTITATIGADSVALGTDTTGDYVQSLVAGTGITLTNNTGEGATPTVAVTANTYEAFGAVATHESDTTNIHGITDTAALVTLTGTQTLTNKTLTSPVITGVSPQITLAGDLTGSVTLTDLGNGTLTATIAANSVALGTDTTGNYVNDVTAGTGVTVSHTPGEGSSPTVAIGQAVATSDSPTFAGATLDAVQIGITASGEIDTSSGNLTIDSAGGTVTVDDNLIVSGDLTVSGTTTTVNTETINLADNIITLNSNETGTPSQNAGLEVERGTSTNVQLRWNETSDKWELSEDGSNYYDIATEAYVDGQTITSLDDIGDVTITSATSGDFLKWNGTAWVNDPVNLGTDTTGDYVGSLVAGTGVTLTNNSGEGATPTVAIGQAVGTTDNVTFNSVTASLTGNADTATTLATSRTIALGGDLSGSASFDGSANITITATIGADSVALGTDTTGNYMEDVSAGTGISVTHTPGEGSTATVALNATLDNLSNVNAPTPSDGQFLKYVSASSEWQPAAIPTINSLDDVGDVSASSPSSGDVLSWNGSAWVSATPSAGATVSDSTPSSPLSGQLWFESDTGRTYVYYDSSWVEVGAISAASRISVSSAAPSSPVQGDTWFDSDDGATYVYYNSNWVEIGASAVDTLLNAIDNKGDLLVGTSDNTIDNLTVGTNGYVLVADSSTTTGLKWAIDPTTDLVTTKGDLLVATAADTVSRLGVGSDGQILVANSSETTGLEWQTPTYASTGKAIAMAIVFGS